MKCLDTLGKRLFATFLFIVVLCSVLARMEQMYEYTRPETGIWDRALQDIAVQIVASTPRRLADIPAGTRPDNYDLPEGAVLERDELSFQIWNLRTGQIVMHSPGAPAAPLSASMREGFSENTLDGQQWRVYARSDAEGRIQVQVAKTREQLKAEYRTLLHRNLRFTTLFVLLMTGGVWLVLRRTLRPLNSLRETILRRPAMDLAPLPHDDLPRDLRPLIDAVNRLLARLDEAVQKEKRFVADAAHELRTPLAVLESQAQVVRQASDPAEAAAALDKLQQAVHRSARLAEQLLDQARLDNLEDASLQDGVAVDRLVNVMTRELETRARNKNLRIVLDARACTIRGNIDALGVLLANLLDNAIRHTPPGGTIRVACRQLPDGDALLSVADNGPGVPPAEYEKIFDRFYRVPGNRERGSGIGLSLVERVAALHGATRRCGLGLDGRGLEISLTFPPYAAANLAA